MNDAKKKESKTMPETWIPVPRWSWCLISGCCWTSVLLDFILTSTASLDFGRELEHRVETHTAREGTSELFRAEAGFGFLPQFKNLRCRWPGVCKLAVLCDCVWVPAFCPGRPDFMGQAPGSLSRASLYFDIGGVAGTDPLSASVKSIFSNCP